MHRQPPVQNAEHLRKTTAGDGSDLIDGRQHLRFGALAHPAFELAKDRLPRCVPAERDDAGKAVAIAIGAVHSREPFQLGTAEAIDPKAALLAARGCRQRAIERFLARKLGMRPEQCDLFVR